MKWGYFNQIIFNSNKTAFEIFFARFSQALITLLSHIIPGFLDIIRLDRLQPGYIVNGKLEKK